ncbi:hypothetical protein Pla108_07120 [Botrimarina colliarenosi]|uniref:PEP-CTERM protein-sorting domain-containing protein n=1 Tax=Botrimarina colliarenosi TaxID=2528001 RepID=A0A5C6AJE6_9BACT|nr:PEP-CTERM sorting domain-containing protein [Botrimarina colliarenosi]TWT99769.1 hypothetical protein Pla108_07120 [Botrimarina colliarenosi]
MSTFNQSLLFKAVVSVCSCYAGSAAAALVSPGDFAALSGTTSAATPVLAGTVQDDPLRAFEIRDGSDNLLVSGNLQDRVSLSDDLGTLVFSPRIRDTAGVPGFAPMEIFALQITGYGGYTTEIEFRTDGSGDQGPDSVSRSADGEGLRFHYNTSPLLPPDESYFNSILTDATAFAPIGTATIFARVGSTGPIYTTTLEGINVPVPEPTASVLVLGALGLAATVRRRG